VKIGLKDWGPAIIDALVEEGLVNDIADLYKVSWRVMADVKMKGRKIGESTAEKLFDALHMHKYLPLHVVIGSLGIPLCARSVAKVIVDAGYDTVEKMQAATVAQISSIPGLGPIKAQWFVTGLAKKRALIQKLSDAGIRVKAPATGALKGKKVCFTGFRDADMEAAVEEMGGTMKSSVSKDLDLLVTADPNSTSGKAQKARSQGTKIIGVDEMRALLGE
jgi:DNA ligase (NAD+)